MSTAKTFLTDLQREIATHPGVNHLLLNRLATAPFSRQDYRVFAENHFPLVCVFTSYLEALLVRAPDSGAKLWLAKVLIDEYGEGSHGHDHSKLYAGFLTACGGDPSTVRQAPIPSAAAAFVLEHRRIVTKEPFLVGLGAVGPGHEWAIPAMFDAVIPGLRRAGFSDDEIDYFTLHVHQDEDHGRWLGEALLERATTDLARHQIRDGALRSLEARRQFWDGVQRAIVRWRQPRAARQDAASPRSLGRELLVTAWDRSAIARALETRLRDLRDRRRPTLEALIASTRELS